MNKEYNRQILLFTLIPFNNNPLGLVMLKLKLSHGLQHHFLIINISMSYRILDIPLYQVRQYHCYTEMKYNVGM